MSASIAPRLPADYDLTYEEKSPTNLSGGIVAYNEEENLEGAVRSLLDQELPWDVRWNDLWIVASGCADRTVEIAERLVSEDRRVRLITEPERRGKARALQEVFRRAEGNALVLLNGDARAEPGAIAELVRVGAARAAPYAVMARPVVPGDAPGRWAPTFRWMWDLHHEFHAELLARGDGRHLSDELLLVSLPSVPAIPDGIINDGSYLAVWLSQHAGGGWYAPYARVSIRVPSEVRDYLHQRRRIHVGNAQVSSVLGDAPATIPREFLRHPAATVRVIRRMIDHEGGLGHLVRLATWELAAHGLAAWDRLPPQRDHVRWRRIGSPTPPPGARGTSPSTSFDRASGATQTERRVASLLLVAGEFGTGIPLERLQQLLPANGPESVDALERWLQERPWLAQLQNARAYAPTTSVSPAGHRGRRAFEFRQFADSLWRGPLSFSRDLVRCIGITGSVAFDEPLPDDDLDLFVVTRSGALWWFLARAYFSLFLSRRRPALLRGPTPCLNYVLEDRAASPEFARPRDLLFAREALSVHVLHGEDYYRGVLASAGWMRTELPYLYDSRTRSPGGIATQRAPTGIRMLNAIAYPLLATYLQLVGLVRNAHARRRGTSEDEFRTETGGQRLVFASRRFEQLRRQYSESGHATTGREGREVSPHAPAVR
ncbi:MAG: glycosyltransferase family 2 protein [Thermoplasmata archaeon]